MQQLNPLELISVSFGYERETIISDVNLTIKKGEYCLLLGTNGSGKSTLLKVALGILPPSKGEVRLFNHPPTHPQARSQLGYVPQRSAISPKVPATVLEVVVAGRAGRPHRKGHQRNDRELGLNALEQVGLANLAKERIGFLSGGQQQRVLIARALAGQPSLLILDEPTAGVDKDSHLQFASILRELNKNGVAIVLAAHDLGAIGNDLTRVIALHQGHLDEIEPAVARQQIGLFVEDHHA